MPTEAAPLVVPLRDALVVLAVLVVLALAANLALYAYLAAQSTLPAPPSPGSRECGWEKGPGDEGPREGAPSPATRGRVGEGASGPGEGPGQAGSSLSVPARSAS